MTIELLSRLRALDVTLALEGDRLKVSAPEGSLRGELRAELTARKAELVAWLRAHQTAAATDRIPAARARSLSFAQQRFWFFHNLTPDTAAYHLCFGVRFEGRLDGALLARCLTEVARRHEILRTVYEAPDGQPRPVLLPSAAIDVPLVELTALAGEEPTARFPDLAREFAARPFDLRVEPPLRTRLFALDPEDHALVIVVHHIAGDAWSVGVLVRELLALYDALSAGRPSPLAELPIQYADFASWQRQRLETGDLDAQRDYWVRQLAELPALQLPTDRPRPPFQTFRGGREPIALSRRVSGAIDAVARRERATPFMVLLAAFNTLLYRCSGQTDLVLGTAVAGRQRPEFEPLIGPFINTLVLRTDASGNPTFRTLLRRVRDTLLDAYANQDLPFERVVDELRPDRSLSRNPLFQVMFALQNVPAATFPAGELGATPFDIDRGTAVSDLEIMLWPVAGGLTGYARYSADLFEPATVRQLLDRFHVLLEAVVAHPDLRLSELSMATDADRTRLTAINVTEAEYERDALAHEVFERHAAQTPEAIALAGHDGILTYRELDTRANRLARRLLATGIGADDRVAICLDRSPAFAVAALAVLKAGGAYLPLDPAYPVERLAFMLSDAGAKVVLTNRSLHARVTDSGATALYLDEGDAGELSGEAPRVSVHALNLAYVIYTSGSTGRPKGVALSHRGLMNLCTWHQRAYRVTPQDRAALVAGLGFDASVWELWPYLTAGASVHVPDDETRASAAALLEWLAESNVSICFAPTPLAEAMIESVLPAGLRLRALLTGGDKLHGAPAGLPFTLYNNYGPTENTVVSTWTSVGRDGTAEPPPIGKPIANTRVHVLDRWLAPVPPGVPGELYVAGEGLARGYLRQPAQTAESFLPDPFAETPGSRMYRTGDVVRMTSRGDLEFLGRVDEQVKVRGFRIELGEIEAVLRQHPDVREAVVVAREHASGAKRLLAYLVASGGGPVESAAVKRYASSRLPDYMVPAAFTWLPALPLTANGKIDRAALPEPSADQGLADAATLPRSDVERRLADVWKSVLRLETVGIHDNFFEVGGDSILALQVIAAARPLGLRLTPRQIFEQPTVAELAATAICETARPASFERPAGEVPLTPIQHWFVERGLSEPWHFNQALMLVAREPLDRDRLENALRHLLDHHDALRLRFVRGENGWRQFYAPPGAGVPVDHVELSPVSAAARAAVIRSEADRVQSSLNLADGPLVRAALFDAGAAAPQHLLLAIHHLVVDTVSWRILLADLQQAYAQLADGEVSLTAKTSSFKAWATRLEAYAAAGVDPSELRYWRDFTPSQPVFPVDFPGGLNTAASLNTVSMVVSPAETEALLRDVPQSHGMQIHEVLLAATGRALAAWTGHPSVLLSMENHGRDALFDDLDLSRTVGWFTAMYPLQLDLAGAADPGDTLKRVKEQARSVPNRGAGYGILRYLGQGDVAARLASTADPLVSFNYLGQFEAEAGRALLTIGSEPTGAIYSPQMTRSHLIDVSAHVAGARLRLTLHYSETVHRRSTIERLAGSIVSELAALIGYCRTSLSSALTPSDFPEANITQDELDRLLARVGQAGSY